MSVKAERFIAAPRACNLSITHSAQTHSFARLCAGKSQYRKIQTAADKRKTAIQQENVIRAGARASARARVAPVFVNTGQTALLTHPVPQSTTHAGNRAAISSG